MEIGLGDFQSDLLHDSNIGKLEQNATCLMGKTWRISAEFWRSDHQPNCNLGEIGVRRNLGEIAVEIAVEIGVTVEIGVSSFFGLKEIGVSSERSRCQFKRNRCQFIFRPDNRPQLTL